jgi:hypothetical protein
MTRSYLHAGRSAQVAAREAAAAASRAAREPAALQQLGVVLTALQKQVCELAEREGGEDGRGGGRGPRLESRLMVGFFMT